MKLREACIRQALASTLTERRYRRFTCDRKQGFTGARELCYSLRDGRNRGHRDGMGQRAAPAFDCGKARRTGGLPEFAGSLGGSAADAGGGAAENRLVFRTAAQSPYQKNPDLPMERVVTLADFTQSLRQVAEDAGGEYVLIGGLAVGAWASAFHVGDGSPMFSKDIDLRGTRLAAKAVVQSLKSEGVKVKGFVSITRKEPPGLGKNYVAPIELPDGRSTQVEFLEALPWVDDGPDRPYGFGVEVDGIPLLDPLSLFIGKLHAWHHRDDPEKTSNDRLHLELLGEIIPKFVAEAERRGVDTRERREVLLGFLDQHATPLADEALAGLRQALLPL
ncbi:MAG: nucleotidyl transferase AbiEii/AbiGii toxin family protein [Luteolibacter sp.]